MFNVTTLESLFIATSNVSILVHTGEEVKMASLLRVVLATCIIFAGFVCGRTLEGDKDQTIVRQDTNEQDIALQRHRRAPPGVGNGGNFGGQGGQFQPQANMGNGMPMRNAAGLGPGNNWQAGGGGGRQFAAGPGLQANLNEMNRHDRGQQQGFQQNPGLQNQFLVQQGGAAGGGQGMMGGMQPQPGGMQPNMMQGQGPYQGGGDQGQIPVGGGGKQMARDMRQRKKQLANALRPLRIAETDICRDDVMTLCGKNARGNNFAVLDCLQNARQVSMKLK